MAKKDYKFTFHILVGLPGSGKTYFAESNFPNQHWSHTDKFHIDLDACKKTGNFEQDILNALSDEQYAMDEIYCRGNFHDVDICLDGLVTTIGQIKSVMNVCIDYMASHVLRYIDYKIKFVIHRWDENRETCILNDIKRVKDGVRENTSKISIENIPFDSVDITDFEEYFDNKRIADITIEKHTVKRITTYDTKFYPLVGEDRNEYSGAWCHDDKPKKTKYMYSESWSGGGTWGNCWGDEGTIYGEDPNDFIEFDNFLESIYPNITFLQYKKIRKECVDVETSYESDYYGGKETIHRWRCDMEKLYELLKDKGFLKE